MHMYVRTYEHIAATNMFQDVSGGLEPALAAEKEEDHYTATVCFGFSCFSISLRVDRNKFVLETR